jgi:hypothetical protein
MGEKRGRYKPKQENIKKLFAFLSKIEKDELRKDIRNELVGNSTPCKQ